VRIRTERRELPGVWQAVASVVVLGLATALSGCGREPSRREVENARAFEALLTAVSLKHDKEVERDAKAIEERHAAGELSDAKYRDLAEIIEKARAKDWAGAEKRAYEFRSQFGDDGSFFD
jgi:hypothetical protein